MEGGTGEGGERWMNEDGVWVFFRDVESQRRCRYGGSRVGTLIVSETSIGGCRAPSPGGCIWLGIERVGCCRKEVEVGGNGAFEGCSDEG